MKQSSVNHIPLLFSPLVEIVCFGWVLPCFSFVWTCSFLIRLIQFWSFLFLFHVVLLAASPFFCYHLKTPVSFVKKLNRPFPEPAVPSPTLAATSSSAKPKGVRHASKEFTFVCSLEQWWANYSQMQPVKLLNPVFPNPGRRAGGTLSCLFSMLPCLCTSDLLWVSVQVQS